MATNILAAADSKITIVSQGDVLVVDSRLIAEDLGVEHTSFMRTVKKYQSETEEEFSLIRFEIEAVKTAGSRGTKYQESCYLTEEQALYLMSLSKNTDQVRRCKRHLVRAFKEAEETIKAVIPAQNETIQQLTLQNEVLSKQLELRHLDNTMLSLHGVPVVLALRGCSDQVVEIETVVTEVCEPDTGKTTKIVSAEQLKKIVKERTGQKLPSLTFFAEQLRKAGRDDLLIPVRRSAVNEYPIPDKLDEAIAIVYGKSRQKLIGE